MRRISSLLFSVLSLTLIFTLYGFTQDSAVQKPKTAKMAPGVPYTSVVQSSKESSRKSGQSPQTAPAQYKTATAPGARLTLPAQAAGKGSRKNGAKHPQPPPIFLSAPVNYVPGQNVLPMGVAIGSLRSNGINDVVSASWSNNNLYVYLGNGDGTLQGANTYSSGAQCLVAVTIADVNMDGIPDLVAGDDCGGPNGDGSVGVLLGNGDGTFQDAVTYDSGGSGANGNLPGMVATGNLVGASHTYNGLPCPDIAISNEMGQANGDGSVGVLINNCDGTGTFQPVVTYDTDETVADGVAIADVNGDGYPDLVTLNNCFQSGCSNGSGVSVLLNSGTGTFDYTLVYNIGGSAVGLAVADLNGDGYPDIIAGDEGAGVVELLNNADGTGSFGSVQYLGSGWQVVSVTVGDINGDGIPDIVAGLGYCGACDNGADAGVNVALGNGDGSFQGWQTYDTGGVLAFGVAIGDLNGDGIPDVVADNGCDSGNFDPYCNGTTAVFLNSVNGLATTVASSANNVNENQPVTYTATVNNPAGSVNGTINFWDNQQIISTQNISSSASTATATYEQSYATGGNQNVTAEYLPQNLPAYSLSPLLVETVLIPQTITFTTPPPATAKSGDSFTVAATGGGSGNPVIFSLGTGSVCTFSSPATFIMTSNSGNCVVVANQAGNGQYQVAPQVTGTTEAVRTVTKVQPTITFTGAPSTAGYLSTFTVATTQNSGITPKITSTTGSVCSVGTVNGVPNTVTMKSGTGTCTVKASWATDDYYLATTATQSTTASLLGTTTTITGAELPTRNPLKLEVYFTVTNGTSTAVKGNVTVFAVNGGETCTGTVTAGKCELTRPSTQADTFIAVYAGNTDNNTSTSAGYSYPPTD
jgi:hypothetical protein